jgi:glycosyltransferase involved in cell wall biosynthesis
MSNANSPSPSSPELSIVVPAYCEGSTLERAIPRVLACARQATSNVEIVVVDDGSNDNTWERVTKLAREHPEVKGIRLSRNYGKDAAICAGLADCAGKAAIVIDADLQHPPELIPRLFHLWKDDGFQVVEAVKTHRREESILRRQASHLFNHLAKTYAGLKLDNSTDFVLLSREVLQAWGQVREYRVFFRGIVNWLGFQKTTVSFEVQHGLRPRSTWTTLQLFRLGLHAIISFSSAPLRIAHLVSFVFVSFGTILGIQTLVRKLVGRAVDGFTTVIILLLIVGGLILGVLGIISEYLAAIYDEVKQRPRYLVSATTGKLYEPPKA